MIDSVDPLYLGMTYTEITSKNST